MNRDCSLPGLLQSFWLEFWAIGTYPRRRSASASGMAGGVHEMLRAGGEGHCDGMEEMMIGDGPKVVTLFNTLLCFHSHLNTCRHSGTVARSLVEQDSDTCSALNGAANRWCQLYRHCPSYFYSVKLPFKRHLAKSMCDEQR